MSRFNQLHILMIKFRLSYPKIKMMIIIYFLFQLSIEETGNCWEQQKERNNTVITSADRCNFLLEFVPIMSHSVISGIFLRKNCCLEITLIQNTLTISVLVDCYFPPKSNKHGREEATVPWEKGTCLCYSNNLCTPV